VLHFTPPLYSRFDGWNIERRVLNGSEIIKTIVMRPLKKAPASRRWDVGKAHTSHQSFPFSRLGFFQYCHIILLK